MDLRNIYVIKDCGLRVNAKKSTHCRSYKSRGKSEKVGSIFSEADVLVDMFN